MDHKELAGQYGYSAFLSILLKLRSKSTYRPVSLPPHRNHILALSNPYPYRSPNLEDTQTYQGFWPLRLGHAVMNSGQEFQGRVGGGVIPYWVFD